MSLARVLWQISRFPRINTSRGLEAPLACHPAASAQPDYRNVRRPFPIRDPFVKHKAVRLFVLCGSLGLGFGFLDSPVPRGPAASDSVLWARPTHATGGSSGVPRRRPLGRGHGDFHRGGGGQWPSRRGAPRPSQVERLCQGLSGGIRSGPGDPGRLVPRRDCRPGPPTRRDGRPGLDLAARPPDRSVESVVPACRRVVVCRSEPNGVLLQAACLAGAVGAPLFVLHDEPGEAAELRRWLVDWGTREVFAAGAAVEPGPDLPDVRVVPLADEAAVAACYLRHQETKGPLHALVVANPSDSERGLSAMSALAPYVALQQRAALLLTNGKGTDAAEVVVRRVTSPGAAVRGNPDSRG